MESVRAMLVPAAVFLSVVGVVGCSGGGDVSPTAVRSLSPASSLQHTSIADNPWSAAVNLGPVVNSAFADGGPGISRNGLSLYFASNRPGGSGNLDIWVAHRDDEDAPWGAPVNLGATVNSPALESVPTFSRDGHRMFFVSDRAGGFGAGDIWVSFREDKDDDFGWQAPVNLGSPINSTFNDQGPASVQIGGEEFLFFNRNRPGVPGTDDIYVSLRQEDGLFGTPVLVAELNSPVTDARATIHHDGREVFFFSNRTGSVGAFDLWTSTRVNPETPWSTPVNLGAVVNTTFDDQQPAISRDGRTLYFSSNRPGGVGQGDLYMITRENGAENDDENDD